MFYREGDATRKWIIYGVEDLRVHPDSQKKISHREDGSLLSIEEFFGKLRHGECTSYHPDGSLYEKRYYQHGTVYGPYEKHNADGTVEKRML